MDCCVFWYGRGYAYLFIYFSHLGIFLYLRYSIKRLGFWNIPNGVIICQAWDLQQTNMERRKTFQINSVSTLREKFILEICQAPSLLMTFIF